jgi:hypothetical protein
MPVNVIATSLMPLSQTVSWTLVLRQAGGPASSPHHFYPTIGGVAFFYCAWALYNRYLGGVPQELGQFSMGIMVLACYTERRLYCLAACTLIMLNYLAPLGLVVPLSAEQMARQFKKDTRSIAIVWAYIFKLYLLSNLALWSTVFYQIYQS